METNELLPQDAAMEAFRKIFPLTRPQVSDDGMTMTYRLRNHRDIEGCLIAARVIIFTRDLPLTVERDRFAIGNLVFEDNLIIRFDATQQQLPCY